MASPHAKNKIRVAVIGASGYAGLELVRLLVRHPGVELTAVTSREWAGRPFSQVFPALAGICDLPFSAPNPEVIAAQAAVVFTSVPHLTAMEVVPQLLASDCRVVDLSADFPVPGCGYLRKMVPAPYGPGVAPGSHLRPAGTARLCHQSGPPGGEPGCYPTCVILGFAPLVQNKLIHPDSLIADCVSGVSGAGRQQSLATQYCEVNEGFRAYKVARHPP